jgi:glyoxylase-like metal-dependent hydrolase (beta-lactamase superfamily II)
MAAGLATGACATAVAQMPDFSKVEIRTQALADNLYLLDSGSAGNVALLVGADGAVLVDNKVTELAGRMRAAVALLTDRPVRFVINTHFHLDHSGTNDTFGRAGGVIVAHENVRKRLAAGQIIEYFKLQQPPAAKEALPVVTFAQSVDLHLNGEDVHVEALPAAHTDGDAAILFRRANVLHAGDVFIRGSYPFIDTSSGGTIDGLVTAHDRLLALANESTQVIPGHGPMATRADLAAQREMIVTIRDRVAAELKRGRSLEQVIDAAPTRDFDERYGKGFITPEGFLSAIYGTLPRGKPQR